MGRTSTLFKKIVGKKEKKRKLAIFFQCKGILQAKMGMIKDRKSKDLTEAEEIKKRWQEYTELYKKGLNDPDNLMVWSLT